MEQRNDPTTAEIVKALRDEAKMELGGQAATIHLTVIQSVISRLEQLERENAALRKLARNGIQECAACTVQHATEIKNLTARAEKAEAERDAATNDLEHVMLDSGELCDYCSRDWAACYKCEPEWRGLRGKGNA